MRIDTRDFSWTGPFVRDYCHAFDRVAPFFSGSPTDPANWNDAVAARRAHRPASAVAEIVARQLSDRDAPAAAREAAETHAPWQW